MILIRKQLGRILFELLVIVNFDKIVYSCNNENEYF